jgi:hypothetical protein
MNDQSPFANSSTVAQKFVDPFVTAKGEYRASVSLSNPSTLWFNTGTLCNITCQNCYIESSPTNDQLVYIDRGDVENYLDQIEERTWPVTEIAFTGGEPFMNPAMNSMAHAALKRGYDVLILTNAMAPMMRIGVFAGLKKIQQEFGSKLTLRISIDHYSDVLHDRERGVGAFAKTLHGMKWLRDNGVKMAVAGRTLWGEDEQTSRAGYDAFFKEHGFDIDANDPGMTVLFPEMDQNVDVPEISTGCWNILNKNPNDMMCASSRMVVKRNGADKPAVLACTLLAYDTQFELGHTLKEAEKPVQLNHRHCSKFCVLGGASCSR